ncbi:murein biosynthesis integral membrane protein MurJ [Candidatus Falkowbacteria bacterium RIFOXYC2_FULL_48_21]|uniref:Murein biosynthesis integral membrane protein MurJ n=1 Tax=Candidatus Falkowbacteria bacterium RIFOXYC2_FULL_48_21 TaxID=1798005 RepID=A0A1F5T550_9BACT|nr:MAG: murein biosynthesis integral membrane protein MurJ [Candidatus Falkowbacteria bacterium RIFOXYC2_FULL_48_21]
MAFEENKASWGLVSNIINILALFLLAVSALLAVLSPWLVPWITPGFSGEKLHLTITLTRIMFLSPVLLGLSGVFSGVLQAHRRFVIFSLAPIMYNAGIIFGALFLTQRFGVYGLAFGVIIGAALHLFVQIPSVFKLGYVYRAIVDFKESNFIKIVKMTGPRILGLASAQFNLIVITILASTLVAGSLAIFNFANNLQSLAIGLIGVSFAVAAFPALSKSFADNNKNDFRDTFLRTFKQIMFFVIPLSILFIILRMQIVRVVLGSGRFDWQDTILTGNAFGVFCLSLFAQALLPLLARTFYARHNTLIPFVGAFVALAVNAVLSWLLIARYGVVGLAWGFTISSIVNFAVLFAWLKVKVKEITHDHLVRTLAKISFASMLMAVAAQYVKTWIGEAVDMDRFWGVCLQGAVAGVVGLVVFTLVAYLLKTEELINFMASLKRKLFKEVRIEKEGAVE